MAISHVQPLFLLLASLFFLPFSHAVDFEYCNNVGYALGTVTGLEVNPYGPSDPRLRISLSFTTSATIKTISPTGTLEVSLIYENMNIPISSTLLCTAGVCPLEPSTSYTIIVSVIPPAEFLNPKYVISLNDIVGDIGDPEKLCVFFDIPN